MEIRARFCGEHDDVHDLNGRRGTHVSAGSEFLADIFFLLTQTTAPTEQVSMTVMIKRSITWSTDADLKLVRASKKGADRDVLRTLVPRPPLAQIVEQEETTRGFVSSEGRRLRDPPHLRNEHCVGSSVLVRIIRPWAPR